MTKPTGKLIPIRVENSKEVYDHAIEVKIICVDEIGKEWCFRTALFNCFAQEWSEST